MWGIAAKASYDGVIMSDRKLSEGRTLIAFIAF